MREIINQSIDGIASQYNVDEQFVRHYVYVSLIVIFALVCGVVFKKLIVPLIKRIILKTSFKFDDYLFSSSGSVIKYEGFRRVYMVSSDNDEEKSQTLPLLNQGDKADVKNAHPACAAS